MTPWTQRRLTWITQAVQLEPPAQETTPLDYLDEVEHLAPRLEQRWHKRAVHPAPGATRQLLRALRHLLRHLLERCLIWSDERPSRRGGRKRRQQPPCHVSRGGRQMATQDHLRLCLADAVQFPRERDAVHSVQPRRVHRRPKDLPLQQILVREVSCVLGNSREERSKNSRT